MASAIARKRQMRGRQRHAGCQHHHDFFRLVNALRKTRYDWQNGNACVVNNAFAHVGP